MKFSLINFILCIFMNRFAQIHGVYQFPNNFRFGVGTSAYQVEGAISLADKVESILDNFTKENPDFFGKSRGDVSADSYHFYKRDIEMLQELKVDAYHFSISWTRLLPSSNKISKDGVKYYNNIIDGLLAKNITPYVSLYYWDLPQKLQDLGGWSSPNMIEYFVQYAEVVFKEFGSKVKNWITFNDVATICHYGRRYYLPQYIPSKGTAGVSDYICAKTVLLAHAKVYEMYRKSFKNEQKGRVGISFSAPWIEPLSDSTRDLEIADLAMQFHFDRFVDPIFSTTGNYPTAFSNAVANRSATQGYNSSRLPTLSLIEINLLRGSADFLGISVFDNPVYAFEEIIGQHPAYTEPSVANDLGYFYLKPDALQQRKLSFDPYANPIYNILMRLKNKYNNTEVIVTANGIGTPPGLVDLSRIFYMQNSILNIGKALKDGCNVTGYFFWTLMDGFQWADGYRVRTGLYEVDFRSEKKVRTPRLSSLVYKNIIERREVDPLYNPIILRNMTLSSGSSHPLGNITTLLSVLIMWTVKLLIY